MPCKTAASVPYLYVFKKEEDDSKIGDAVHESLVYGMGTKKIKLILCVSVCMRTNPGLILNDVGM